MWLALVLTNDEVTKLVVDGGGGGGADAAADAAADARDEATVDDSMPGRLRGSVSRDDVYGLENGGGDRRSLPPSSSRGSYVLSHSPYAYI